MLTAVRSAVNVSNFVPDTASPYSVASADATTDNPLTIPAGATGFVVNIGIAGVAGDIIELSNEVTPAKGDGMLVRWENEPQVFALSEIGGSSDDNFHLHWVAGAASIPITIHYTF